MVQIRFAANGPTFWVLNNTPCRRGYKGEGESGQVGEFGIGDQVFIESYDDSDDNNWEGPADIVDKNRHLEVDRDGN